MTTTSPPRWAIVNEAFARRFFAGRPAIGQRFGGGKPTTEIVGVVRDIDRGGVVFQAPIPEGTHVMFCHRTEKNVLGGSEVMARELKERLAERSPWAVLGFECGARTFPFLGPASTRGGAREPASDGGSAHAVAGHDGLG